LLVGLEPVHPDRERVDPRGDVREDVLTAIVGRRVAVLVRVGMGKHDRGSGDHPGRIPHGPSHAALVSLRRDGMADENSDGHEIRRHRGASLVASPSAVTS
jgi:hypothetical protein